MTKTIKGPLRNFALGTNKGRKYTLWSTNYGTLREYAKVDVYSGDHTQGEQRGKIDSWVGTIAKAVEDDNYTPTVLSASVSDESCVSVDEKIVTIKPTGKIFSITDGCQRTGAFEKLRNNASYARLVDQLPVDVLIMLESEFRTKDFLNLNKGKPVNATHIRRLLIDTDQTANPGLSKMSKEIAELLQSDTTSHLNNQINMFGRGAGGVDFSAITSEHKSEQAMSLYGAAMIADKNEKDARWAADRITEAWQILESEVKDLVSPGAVLCPPPNGKKRPANMIVGMGNMIAYRLLLTGEEKISDAEIELFVSAAKSTFGYLNDLGNASNQRSLLGDFIDAFFEDLQDIDLNTGWHCGIPISLANLFSMASFGREALPKTPKAKKVKEIKKLVVSDPVVEEEIVLEVNQNEVDTDPAFQEAIEDELKASTEDVDTETLFD